LIRDEQVFPEIVSYSEPDKAAKMLCDLAIDPRYESSTGIFYKYDGTEIKSSKYSYNKELQEKLWTVSEQLLKSSNI